MTNLQANFSHKAVALLWPLGVATCLMCLWLTCCGWTHTSKARISRNVLLGARFPASAGPVGRKSACPPWGGPGMARLKGILAFSRGFKTEAADFPCGSQSLLASPLSQQQPESWSPPWLTGIFKSHKQRLILHSFWEHSFPLILIFVKGQHLEISGSLDLWPPSPRGSHPGCLSCYHSPLFSSWQPWL